MSSVDNGREGGVLFDTGAGNFAFHADALAAQTNDYRVPSLCHLAAPDVAELPSRDSRANKRDRQPNSWTRSNEQSVGGSYIFLGGFAGMAYTRYENLYAIPGADGEGHGTRIDAHQDKLTGKGEYRPSASGIDAVRYWWGYTDYKHNEIGFADPADPTTDGIRSSFTNKDLEGRAEVQLMPFNLRFVELTTAIGVQGGHRRLTAPGKLPTARSTGSFDPNKNSRVAGYIFDEFKFSNTTKAQIAGRIEQVNLSGTTPEFIPDTFTDTAAIGPATPRNLSLLRRARASACSRICHGTSSAARPRNTSSARRSRRSFSRGALTTRRRPSISATQSEHRSRKIRRGRSPAGQRTLPVRGDRLLHRISTGSSSGG